jgi:hypothetical protein
MGPDLTNVISAVGKGPLFAKAPLQYGSERMPNYHLTQTEIDELVAFLTFNVQKSTIEKLWISAFLMLPHLISACVNHQPNSRISTQIFRIQAEPCHINILPILHF